MSQNFDLLNAIGEDYAVRGAPSVRPRAASPSIEIRQPLPNSALQSLAQTVFLSGPDTAPHVVLFCGVDEENGSSQICSELGRILARTSSKPVCLVDGDLRGQRLSRIFGQDATGVRVGAIRAQCAQHSANLWVAPIGLLGGKEEGALAPAAVLKQAITDLRHAFEFVLIDAPGVNSRGDAGTLGQLADAAILLLEANATRRPAALKAKAALEAMKVRVLGTVLNNRTYPIPDRLYRRI